MGVLIFANLLFLTITILAHQFLDSFEGSNTTVSEDMLNERAFAAKGHTDPNAGPEVAIDVKVSLMSIGNCDHACDISWEQQGPGGCAVEEGCCIQKSHAVHNSCQIACLNGTPAPPLAAAAYIKGPQMQLDTAAQPSQCVAQIAAETKLEHCRTRSAPASAPASAGWRCRTTLPST